MKKIRIENGSDHFACNGFELDCNLHFLVTCWTNAIYLRLKAAWQVPFVSIINCMCHCLSGTTLLKKSRHLQFFHGITIEIFFLLPWNLQTRGALARPHFLPFFVHGCSRLELVDLCRLRLLGGGYAGSLGPSTFGDDFSPHREDPDCFYILIRFFFAIRYLNALQSSAKRRIVSYGATCRCTACPFGIRLLPG